MSKDINHRKENYEEGIEGKMEMMKINGGKGENKMKVIKRKQGKIRKNKR